jgi:hypothetical protein
MNDITDALSKAYNSFRGCFFMTYGNSGNFGKYGKPFRPANPSNKKHPKTIPYSIQDLFKGKNLDLIAAALLLSGKLKVDSVELYRGSPVIAVTLLGQYMTPSKSKQNALADFLEENGDMTLDDVFEALQKRMEKGE